MTPEEQNRIVESMLFAADSPMKASTLARILEQATEADVRNSIAALNDVYAESGRSFQIVQVAGGYQMTTRSEFAPWLRKMYAGRTSTRLSQAALETLAIIAFKQPVAKSDVAAIRGVNTDGVVRSLLEKRLITITGRAESVGRPLLYATTDTFLQYFGINQLSDLPKPREIEELFGDSKYANQIVETLSALEEEGDETEPAEGDADVAQAEVTEDAAASEDQT